MAKRDKGITGLVLGDRAIGLAVGTVGKGVKLLGSALRPPGLLKGSTDTQESISPGEVPGIEHFADVDTPPPEGTVQVSWFDYASERVESHDAVDLHELLVSPRPDWVHVRWINVTGIHPYVVNRFRQQFDFHTLTAEDVLHIPQRPRAEIFDDHIFVVMRMLRLLTPADGTLASDTALETEQVSLFLYADTVITFQERPGDVWQPIRERLQVDDSRVRRYGAGYLLYTLLDAIVDHCFPVLEEYGDILEDLELTTLENPTPEVLHRIHSIKRELALLRRIVWPSREVVDALYREEGGMIGDDTRPYLRDVYEHTIQIVEIIESYREMTSGLTDLYMSAVSNRMNEIMKVLTIMASVFIPLTFIAGIYGMNFEHMPELGHPIAYGLVWVSFFVIAAGMVWYFRHRGWFGRHDALDRDGIRRAYEDEREDP